MEKPRARTYFVALAFSGEMVPTELVLLAEATLMLLFGSLMIRISQVLMNPSLPAILYEGVLNRSNPFGTGSGQSFGNDQTTFRRLKILDNCLRSGPFNVHVQFHEDGQPNSYSFYLFKLVFTIPVATGRLWRLEKDPVINVEWIVSTLESHPQGFASKASPGSTGEKLEIRVFKDS